MNGAEVVKAYATVLFVFLARRRVSRSTTTTFFFAKVIHQDIPQKNT